MGTKSGRKNLNDFTITNSTLAYLRKGTTRAGGKLFRSFLSTKPYDGAIIAAVNQRRARGLAFPGGRPFRFFKGSGFCELNLMSVVK